MRRIDIFVLLGDGIRPFILYDQQKSIALKVLEFEFKPPPGIRLGLRLYRTADPYHRIYRRGVIFICSNDPGYFGCAFAFKLIVQGYGKSNYCCNGGKDDLGLAKEIKYGSFGDHIGKGGVLKITEKKQMAEKLNIAHFRKVHFALFSIGCTTTDVKRGIAWGDEKNINLPEDIEQACPCPGAY